MHRAIRSLLKKGVVRQDKQKRYGLTGKKLIHKSYKLKPNDRRKLPRISNRPTEFTKIESIILDLINEKERFVSQVEVKKRVHDVVMMEQSEGSASNSTSE